MAYWFSNKIILWSGIFCGGLYALVSFGVNLIDESKQPYFYLVVLFFLLYLNYFFLWKYFDPRNFPDKDLKAITIFFLFFVLVSIFLVPKASGDFYHYVFEDAALVSYNQNPYLISPQELPTEPLSWLSNWRELPSQHGPFKFFLTPPAFYLSQGLIVPAIFIYKVLYAVFLIGSACLVYQILNHLNHPKKNLAFLLFAWNPLIIFTPAISGGNDVLLLFWTLLAIFMALQKKFYQATLFLTLSILTKYVTIVLLPIFFIYYLSSYKNFLKKAGELLKHLLIFSLTTLVLFWPFWQGPEIFDGLFWTANYFSNNSFPATLFLLLLITGLPVNIFLFKRIFEGIFIITYAVLSFKILLSKQISKENFLAYLVLVMLLFIMLAKFWIFYKYFVWLIPLIYLLDKKYFFGGVFLTGLVVLGEVSLGYVAVLLIPSIIVFILHYVIVNKLKLLSFNG